MLCEELSTEDNGNITMIVVHHHKRVCLVATTANCQGITGPQQFRSVIMFVMVVMTMTTITMLLGLLLLFVVITMMAKKITRYL